MNDVTPYFNLDYVVTTRSGGQYLITSMRGRVNVKGRKLLADGTFDAGGWTIPYASVKDARTLTDAERETLSSGPKLELGSVVRFKSAPKGEKADQKFVVFKDAGDSVSVTRLGGGAGGRYFRGITLAHVDIVPVD